MLRHKLKRILQKFHILPLPKTREDIHLRGAVFMELMKVRVFD
jgi:uncharacterized membrane protein YgaE (UPF0421/DUF939 family)